MSEEEKKQKLLDMWDKESLANEWVKEHIKYNYTKEDLDQAQEIIIELQQRIGKVRKYVKKCMKTTLKINDYWTNELVNGKEILKILGETRK